MKLVLILIFIFVNIYADSLMLTQAEKKWISDNKEVLFTGDPQWLPYEYFDKNGKYGGIVSEYLNIIEKRTGLKINKHAPSSWTEVLDIAKKKEVSIISGDISDITLNKSYLPIEPYMINTIVIVMNQKNHYVEGCKNISSKKIAIIKGYGYTSDIFKKYPDIKFIEKENINIALTDLSNGDIDALLVSELLAKYYINQMEIDNVRIVGHTDIIMKITLFIDSKLPLLHSIINKTIKSIHEREKVQISNKWITAHQHEYSIINIWIISFVVIILIVMIILMIKSSLVSKHQKKLTTHLKSAQTVGHIGSWEFFMDTGKITWSDEIFRIFGEIPQSFEPTYEAFLSYIPIEFHEGLQNAVDESIRLESTYEFDHYIIRKDGSKRYVREAGYVKTDENNKPLSMLGTTLDVTSIQDAEIVTRKNVEMSELLRKFDDNVIASNTDLNGIIIYASNAFCDICGYSKEELIGHSHNILKHEDMSSDIYTNLWFTIQSGHVWKGELKNKRKDGSYYWVSSTISPTLDEEGNVIGYNSIRHDITKDKQYKELNRLLEQRVKQGIDENKNKDHILAQQNKLASMGEMIGNIAHQWRQPLNTLSLLVQKTNMIYKKGNLDDVTMDNNTKKSMDVIKQMSDTINDFKNFFAIDKEFTYCSTSEIIEQVDTIIGTIIKENHIKFDVVFIDDITISCLKNELSQVVLNIVSNSIDEILSKELENGEIKVTISQSQSNVVINIADNAGGIPANIIDKIFEPYFTTKAEGKGTGIGLYMSKIIIERNMNGSLNVHNTAQGALFSIILPINKQA